MKMKTIFVTISCILLSAAVSFGDEIDERLPNNTPQELKISTRQMISAGVAPKDAVEITNTMLQRQFSRENILAAQKVLTDTRNK